MRNFSAFLRKFVRKHVKKFSDMKLKYSTKMIRKRMLYFQKMTLITEPGKIYHYS